MKQCILAAAPYAYKKHTDRRIGLCIALLLLTLGLNILFTALRTDSNHGLMLILNIAVDVLCGFFLLYEIEMHILPRVRLYRLFLRKQEQFSATVEHISDLSQRYMDIDCYTVTADGRRLFLPVGTLTLENAPYRFSLSSNIIVEAEQ